MGRELRSHDHIRKMSAVARALPELNVCHTAFPKADICENSA
jgi:hypothetical protein